MNLPALIIAIIFSFLNPRQDEAGERALELERWGSGLEGAVSVYATGGGNLFIVEESRNRFLKMGSDGTRLDSIGRLGTGDYRFDEPRDIDATNGMKVYVSDYRNNRIQVYDRRLQYLSTVHLPRRAGVTDFRPTVLSVNRSGELFFFDADRYRIYSFGGNGRYVNHFSTRSVADVTRLSGIAAMDELYLADPEQQMVHRVSNNGTYLGFMETDAEIRGITSYNDMLWVLTPDQVLVFSTRGRRLGHFQYESAEPLQDIAVYDNHIYVIGYDALYRTQQVTINH